MAVDTTYIRTACENYPHNKDFCEGAPVDKGVVIADVIADLLHLSVELGLDPDHIIETARGYVEADDEEAAELADNNDGRRP